MNKFTRFAGWANRFALSLETLGLMNTIKIFFFGRFTKKPLTVALPESINFVFRGKLDKGVISHFYKEGYLIEDINSQRISSIIDCGANIGDETARFYRHYPNAEIVAIEAAECNFTLLHRNFNQVKKIKLIKGAIWPVEKNLKVVSGSSMESFRVIETSDQSATIAAFTIPNIMQKMKWDKIDILKLDIEGSEYELFSRNYDDWIDKVNVFIFEIPDYGRPGTTQAIYRALEGHAYNSYICGENLVLIRANLPWKLKKVIGFNE